MNFLDVVQFASFLQTTQVGRTPRCGARGQLAATNATLYTAPVPTNTPMGSSFGTALLKSIILTNTDTVGRTATIYLVESGGTAADNRAIYKDVALAAKTTTVLTFPDDCCTLDNGETVQGLADAAAKVTYRINVVELSL